MTTHQNHSNEKTRYHRTSGSFSQMIEDLMNSSLSDVFDSAFASTRPHVNVKETDHQFELHVAAPGLNKSDFTLEMKEGMLHISADAGKESSDTEAYKSREFDYSKFKRVFRVSEKVDTGRISARYDNGILVVTLPKRPADSMKKDIPVQ